jgi:hypothetical protein
VRARVVVTSSGFVFERRGEVVTPRCSGKLRPLAELEYLREIEPGPGVGHIVGVERQKSAGRTLETVRLEGGRGASQVVFDVGPTFVEKMRAVHESLRYLMYLVALLAALGALSFMMYRLIWE